MTREIGLRIRYYGDPVLRRRAQAVENITEHDRRIIREMLELMRVAGGIGLAAPQVGISRQIIVLDVGQGPVVLINPRLSRRFGSEAMEEGCLSLPGVHVTVRRPRKVTVSASNDAGEKVVMDVSDILARAVQHEIDHLRGRLIIDYANFFTKIKLKRRLKNIAAEDELGRRGEQAIKT